MMEQWILQSRTVKAMPWRLANSSDEIHITFSAFHGHQKDAIDEKVMYDNRWIGVVYVIDLLCPFGSKSTYFLALHAPSDYRVPSPNVIVIHSFESPSHLLASTLAMCDTRSTTRREYPYSLSYQETTLMKFLFKAIPALASKMEEWVLPIMSLETTSSSV